MNDLGEWLWRSEELAERYVLLEASRTQEERRSPGNEIPRHGWLPMAVEVDEAVESFGAALEEL